MVEQSEHGHPYREEHLLVYSTQAPTFTYCVSAGTGTYISVALYIMATVNLRITAPLEFRRHFETEFVFLLYFKRLLYLLGLGAT